MMSSAGASSNSNSNGNGAPAQASSSQLNSTNGNANPDLSSLTPAQQLQVHLKTLSSLSRDIQSAHPHLKQVLTSINELHENLTLQNGDKLPQSQKQKLKNTYATALNTSIPETVSKLRAALSQIYSIRSIRHEYKFQTKLSLLQQQQAVKSIDNKSGGAELPSTPQQILRRGTVMKLLIHSAQLLPLWIPENLLDEIPELCGSRGPNLGYIAKPGDMVAALQKSSTPSESNWILAEVIHYNSSTQKYDLDDVDEEQKEILTLPKKYIIPLPLMRADPQTSPAALFQPNTMVLALYPQTTCFYKALVTQPPKTHNTDYEVQFEDNTYTEGYSPPLRVPQKYIISWPTIK